MAIVEHLYQQGMLSVAEELCQVTGRWEGTGTCLFYLLLDSFLPSSLPFYLCFFFF